MELVYLKETDFPESCQNGLHYSSVDENIKPDAKSISQAEMSNDDDTLTNFQGFMLLIPTYIGIGFLGLPYMVKLLGLWSGSVGLLFYGFLSELGALILIGSTRRLTERTGEEFGDIGSVAEMSMKLGPPCFQPHAGKFRLSITFCSLLAYGLYMPDLMSLMNLFARDFLQQYVDINDTLTIVGISVLLLPVYLTRRIQVLSRLATAGNIVLLGILIISFQYICRDLPDVNTRPTTKLIDYLTLTTFSNDIMFSYGGIILVLPVRNRMKSTKHFDGWNGLLGVAFAFVISFHVGCGFYGYLQFGELTQVNFILNLPVDNWIYKSLKILCFLVMYCTMGTAVFLVVETIWTQLKDRFSMELVQNYGEYICRVMLLILSCTFTILVPEFQLLMSLTGCFGCHFLTFVVPSIIALLMLYGEENPTLIVDKVKRKLTLICYVLLLIFGIYSMIAGICVSVYSALFHIVL